MDSSQYNFKCVHVHRQQHVSYLSCLGGNFLGKTLGQILNASHIVSSHTQIVLPMHQKFILMD